jgi:hypothetical protein
MLNPSTADHEVDDPTIRKCMGFCRRWGASEMNVVNLFAFRATNPADMKRADDPVGPENAVWVRLAVDRAANPDEAARRGPVVCAWGAHGSYMGQNLAVLGWLGDICQPMVLGITKDGHPRHPLYVSYEAEPVPFRCPASSASSTTSHRSPSPIPWPTGKL